MPPLLRRAPQLSGRAGRSWLRDRSRSMPALHARLGRPRSRGLLLPERRQRRSGVASETNTSGTRRVAVDGTMLSRTRGSAGGRARGVFVRHLRGEELREFRSWQTQVP
eukprot:12294681-Alexandrium_andersonii.AAC.1